MPQKPLGIWDMIRYSLKPFTTPFVLRLIGRSWLIDLLSRYFLTIEPPALGWVIAVILFAMILIQSLRMVIHRQTFYFPNDTVTFRDFIVSWGVLPLLFATCFLLGYGQSSGTHASWVNQLLAVGGLMVCHVFLYVDLTLPPNKKTFGLTMRQVLTLMSHTMVKQVIWGALWLAIPYALIFPFLLNGDWIEVILDSLLLALFTTIYQLGLQVLLWDYQFHHPKHFIVSTNKH